MKNTFKAGAAQIDISPENSQFLYGYPHVKRYSTGVHDKILSSSLYLNDGENEAFIIANDIIYITGEISDNARNRICEKTGVKPEHIMVTATHTHSAPSVAKNLSNKADTAVPEPDPEYIAFLIDRIVESALKARDNARNAEAGLAIADSSGVGTNRRDPNGPSDHQMPVMMFRNAENKTNIACMLVCSMHPTVLHEDSTLVSGDFPGMARLYLQKNALKNNCPVLCHTGPAGNQSPRHVTKENTFAEAERLGNILGQAVEKAVSTIEFHSDLKISLKTMKLNDLPRKTFPDVTQAEKKLENAVNKLNSLRANNAPRQQVRTAECDWFGAEESLTLSRAALDGSLEETCRKILPVEIQIITIGNWNFAGWPGEIFVEYSLEIKNQCPDTFIIAYANKALQGYIVTEQAALEGGYEASNSLFSWHTGQLLVENTIKLLKD